MKKVIIFIFIFVLFIFSTTLVYPAMKLIIKPGQEIYSLTKKEISYAWNKGLIWSFMELKNEKMIDDKLDLSLEFSMDEAIFIACDVYFKKFDNIEKLKKKNLFYKDKIKLLKKLKKFESKMYKLKAKVKANEKRIKKWEIPVKQVRSVIASIADKYKVTYVDKDVVLRMWQIFYLQKVIARVSDKNNNKQINKLYNVFRKVTASLPKSKKIWDSAISYAQLMAVLEYFSERYNFLNLLTFKERKLLAKFFIERSERYRIAIINRVKKSNERKLKLFREYMVGIYGKKTRKYCRDAVKKYNYYKKVSEELNKLILAMHDYRLTKSLKIEINKYVRMKKNLDKYFNSLRGK